MSTVLIKEYTENITNLIPKIVQEPVKSPRYCSKYHNKKPTQLRTEDYFTTGDELEEPKKFRHRTFGVACVPRTPPTEFLKKKTRIEAPRPEVKHVHYKRPGYPKSLPSWTPIKRIGGNNLPELPQDPIIKSGKNFRLLNIVNVKKSRPKEPRKRYVDTRNGSVHNLESSGLVPIHIHRKDYGKIPNFVSKSLKKEESRIDSDERIHQPLCRYITAPERAALLQGMKKKWDEMEKEFQCLPFVIDTLPRVTRKTQMEDALKQLEKDIDIIEKHPFIYVYSDSEEED